MNAVVAKILVGKAGRQCAKTSARLQTSSRASLCQQQPVATTVSSRTFVTGKSKEGSKNEKSTSYFDRKTALKQQRVQDYQHKLERAVQLKKRRDSAPKDVLKNEFRAWWDGRQAYEEILERKAKQAGLPWKVQVATIVERLPVVLPDKMDFEEDFEALQAYLSSSTGKEYPVEFTGTSGADRPVAMTDEELLALLPENFKPAPRETKADEDGTVNTLDRRLKDRVYLMVDDAFPTTEVKADGEESLLEAAKRGLAEQISSGKKAKNNDLPLDLYCPSQAPLAVRLDAYEPAEQQSSGFFGTKTFFVKVQYDDGNIKNNVNFAWLDRNEIVERSQQGDSEDGKFYRYML